MSTQGQARVPITFQVMKGGAVIKTEKLAQRVIQIGSSLVQVAGRRNPVELALKDWGNVGQGQSAAKSQSLPPSQKGIPAAHRRGSASKLCS